MNKASTYLRNNFYSLFLASVFTVIGFSSHATIHRVGCQNYIFVPDSFNAVVGDTVTWYYINGVEHEPTSLVLPAGAPSFQHLISPADTSFSYVITSPTLGTYDYECAFHVSEGMVGKFTVISPAGITPVDGDRPLKVYPIPFQRNLTVDLNNNSLFRNGAILEISNMIGQRKFYLNLSEMQSAPLNLDLSDLDPGIYFLTVSEGVTKKTLRLIKSE